MSLYKDLFDQKAKVSFEHGLHHIYAFAFEDFKQILIELWQFNRPPDEERVKEIAADMMKNQRVDGFIYLATVNNKIVCYEGNHRREAIDHIPTSLQPIWVDMVWNTDDEFLKREFHRLNKAVSVPELYINTDLISVKVDIQDFVKQFCTEHPEHVSPKPKCQRPHFNRDVFTDEITRIIKETGIDVPTFRDRLQKLNEKNKHSDHSKLSEAIRKKCEKSGLWLFIHSTHLDTKDFV